ncbi:hypothetical protein [Methanobacterium alcaliphilum]|uniref:hypothetical protein n=1 Tax=Methanobacterium alcaliphilum TaxID=392018 RepID=UPI00200A65A4|nr:hypothetical protein [Methanobacterium alcaliphilum]MCK9150577.1 hypothetical protein [Methanobacterium alcaliphilum]
MNCKNHPDREGVAACVSCGKVLCEDCRLKLAGKNYCQECADELVSGKSEEFETQEPGTPLASKRISDRYMEEPYEPSRSRSKSQRRSKKGTNIFLLLCVAFVVAIIIIGIVLYAAYVIYLEPQYGDIQNLIQILLNDPQRVLDYLSQQ